MQTVYIDVLIFINMFEDFLLLLCVKYILHLKIKYFRLLLGSLAGGLTSLVVFLPETNFFINLLIKILSAILLIIITFGFNGRKIFIKNVLTLFILSFLFSGAMIFFYLTIKPNGMQIINDTVYFDISPALLIILTLVIYFILLAYKRLFKNHSKMNLIHTIKIIYKNNVAEFKCKTDSGCNVKEPFSGSSVIIVEKELLDGIKLDDKNKRVIPFESLGGSGIIYGFKADEVYIDGKKAEEEIYIGICENILKSEIKGLMPENIIKG